MRRTLVQLYFEVKVPEGTCTLKYQVLLVIKKVLESEKPISEKLRAHIT